MYLAYITLKNFRAYYGENRLEFSPTPDRSISIVAGNNGHGKTSLLTAVVWCLYGEGIKQVEESYEKDIKAKFGYENYLRDLVNRKAAEEDHRPEMYVQLKIRDFTLPFLTSEENQAMQLGLTIRRTVHLEAKRPVEKLQVLGTGTENFELENEKDYQDFIQKYVLPVQIARLYLFDAERAVLIAENLADREVQRELAHDFGNIFGITKYVEIRERLHTAYEERKKQAATLSKQSQLATIEKELADLELQVEEIYEKQKDLKRQRDALEGERQQLLIAVADSQTVSREDFEQARNQLVFRQREHDDCKKQLAVELQRAPFLLMSRRLKEFDELLTNEYKYEEYEKQVALQRRQADQLSSRIRRRLEEINDELLNENDYSEYLTPNLMNRVSNVVTEVLQHELLHLNEAPPKPRTRLSKDLSQNDLDYFKRNLNQIMMGGGASRLANLIERYRQLRNEVLDQRARVSQMEKRLESEQTVEARKRIQDLNAQIARIDQQLGALSDEPKKIEDKIAGQKRRRTELLSEIEVSKNLERTLGVIDQVRSALDRFIEAYKREKMDLVQRRASEMMRRIFHKKDFLQRIRVEAIGHAVRISFWDMQQQKRDFSELSMGERQIVVTALLHALIHESYFSFPVFVDSPLQKLDSDHTRGILENFYVGLHTQTVLLPLLDRELKEEEFELIRHHIDRCYIIAHEGGVSRFMDVGPAHLFATHRKLQPSPTA